MTTMTKMTTMTTMTKMTTMTTVTIHCTGSVVDFSLQIVRPNAWEDIM